MESSIEENKINPDETRKENFPKIDRPDDWHVNHKDCRIDLKDKEQKLSIITCFDEYNMWWSLEYHKVTYLVLTFTIEMIKDGKVYNKDPTKDDAELLTMTSPIVKKWLNSERVKYTQLDQKLFNDMYDILADL